MNQLFQKAILGISLALVSSTAMPDVLQASSQDLEQLLQENVSLIDVRTQYEWRQTGVISNSHLLMFFDERGNYDVDAWLKKLDEIVKPDEPVAIICHVGNRSAVISDFLVRRIGYEQVYNITYGIDHWIRTERPVVPWP